MGKAPVRVADPRHPADLLEGDPACDVECVCSWVVIRPHPERGGVARDRAADDSGGLLIKAGFDVPAPGVFLSNHGMEARLEFVEVSHVIAPGMETYRGLPVPREEVIVDHDTSREQPYGGQSEILISSLHLYGNTGP